MYSWAWIILIWSIFENNNAGDDFCENKWVRHIWMPQFNQKKSFLVFCGPKKMLENAKLHEIVRMSDGRAECHLAFEECRSALLECWMALGHATRLRPWWADFSHLFDICFVFSCFLKNIFFVYNHDTLFYSATNFLKRI